MDKIEKIINIDNSRSHRNGLLPFVQYKGDNSIKEVTAIDTNGNYGQYVCDFCIYSGGTNVEIARLKYLDVLRNYYTIQENLQRAIFTKKFLAPIDLISKIDKNIDENCITAEIPNIPSKTGLFFTEDFEEILDKKRYEYIPLDINLFKKEKNGYIFIEPYFPEGNLSEKQIKLREKVKDHKNKIENKDNTFFVLVPNYDIVISLNSWWDNWWKTNYTIGENNQPKENWEKDVFDGYTYSSNDYFKFCEDVEKYILGQIEVVGHNIKGSKVPNYVYYVNHFELKKWFETHSATTIEAYNNPTKENEWIRYTWEERGGGEFYNFLDKHKPIWQTKKILLNKTNNYFNFAVPTIDLEVIINSEGDYETLYNVYEYSAINGSIEGVVKPYTPPENGLKKQWIDCDNVFCESKLNTLTHPKALRLTKDVFGLFEEFNAKTNNYGQLFECTYCTGYSIAPKVVVTSKIVTFTYTDITNDDGSIRTKVTSTESITENINNDEPPLITLKNTYQVIIANTVVNSSWTETSTNEKLDNLGRVIKREFHSSAFTEYEYGWWECKKSDRNSMFCGDGEAIKPKIYKYRNVLILSYLPYLIGPAIAGDVYYFRARYNNGCINPKDIKGKGGTIISMKIPYILNMEQNIVSYDDGTITYDKIFSTKENTDNTLTIKYGKGITKGDTEMQSGIHYEETLHYEKNILIKVPIDGGYLTELYYDSLGNGTEKVSVYSEDYKQYRYAQLAKITGMEVGTQWTEDGAVEAMLFTKDGYEGLQEEPKYDINLLYNRGNAAAWENHFKLSECNTMEDLENYGNNFFNF